MTARHARVGQTVAVPRIVDVDDPRDPRLADYVSLRDASLRKHLEAEQGLFIAEGEKVIRRAVHPAEGRIRMQTATL